MQRTDIVHLTNEFIYQRYLMNNNHIRQYFKELNIPEYIALNIISETSADEGSNSGKTYLKDLSDKMQVPMRKISKIISTLRDRGLVNWSFDGIGDEGTYVVVTELGNKLIADQEQTLRDYYGRVIEQYGTDNMVQLLKLMKQLEVIMSSELKETEVTADANQTDD